MIMIKNKRLLLMNGGMSKYDDNENEMTYETMTSEDINTNDV